MSEADPRTDDRFHEMLDAWADADPADRPVLEQRIRDVFEETLAVFVLDMSGFSTSVARDGIIPFLGRVSQMRAVAVPAIRRSGGSVVKYIADDILAVFPSADDALAAALEIRAATAIDLGVTQSDMRFQVCMGIGFGPVLHVPGSDLWGDEVNQAFKLGEDTAGPGEILLTERAHQALRNRPPKARPMQIEVSGRRVNAFSVGRAPWIAQSGGT